MYADQELMDEARAYADEVWENVVADIDSLVQVESVEDLAHAGEGMPYGPAPREALTRALGIAGRLGLEAHDCEGYIGYADLRGACDDYVATIAHADIVPLGDGWTVDPLRATRRDGYLLGRGVLDDKGPLVLSLYAAHFFARRVREAGETLPYTLRCIIGANEETGMSDVDYYLEHYPEPAFCFSPDARFPVICGEKGILHATVTSAPMPTEGRRIVSLDGGTVPNAIPGSTQAVVRASLDELAPRDGIAFEDCGDGQVRIVAKGKGGHASMPEGTRNAIGMLVEYLLDEGVCGDEERAFLGFERVLLADAAGEALGIAATDDLFDPLTCVGGTVRTTTDERGTCFVQTIDVRYPKSTTSAQIMDVVRAVAGEHGCAVALDYDAVPFFLSPDCEEVRTLVSTYNQMTDRDQQAFTIGGGTYARHFRRAVAFGPDDVDERRPAWVGDEHGPDEGVSEALLKEALAIYIVSLARLMRLNLA